MWETRVLLEVCDGFADGDGLGETNDAAGAGKGKTDGLSGRGGLDHVAADFVAGAAGDGAGEPVVDTSWSGVDSGVGGVDRDAFAGEAEEGLLLGVLCGERLEATEDQWIWVALVASVVIIQYRGNLR